jgi:hypothetical protein
MANHDSVDDKGGRRCHVSTDENHIMVLCQLRGSLINAIDERHGKVFRDAERKKKKPRYTTHSSDVTQIDGKGFASQEIGDGMTPTKVDVLDKDICRYENEMVSGETEGCRIIPDPNHEGTRTFRIPPSNPPDEPKFSEISNLPLPHIESHAVLLRAQKNQRECGAVVARYSLEFATMPDRPEFAAGFYPL